MNSYWPELTPLTIGCSKNYNLQVPNSDGSLFNASNTPFTGTETLAARLGLGVDQPVLFSPAAAWLDYTVAEFQVSFFDADLAGYVPGDYVLQVTAASGTPTRTFNLFTGYLPLQQLAGQAPALSSYNSMDDMRLYCDWIDSLEHPSRRAQFMQERHRARTWYEKLMMRHFRASGYGISTLGYPIGGIGPFRTGGDNPWLQTQLDANKLLVTDDIKETLSKKSLAFTLEYMLGARSDTPYQQLADRFHFEADNLAIQTTPGLDLNGSGWPSIVLDLSTVDALWA